MIELTADGVAGAADWLRGIVQRSRDVSPVTSVLGSTLVDDMRRHIETAGQSAGQSWAPLAGMTQAIRDHYGHGPKPLIRSGELLESIEQLGATSTTVEVGSRHPAAGVVDGGGPATDPHGRSVDIPARPFALASGQALDALERALGDHLVGVSS